MNIHLELGRVIIEPGDALQVKALAGCQVPDDSAIVIHRGKAFRIEERNGTLRMKEAGKPLGLILPPIDQLQKTAKQ